MTDAPTNTAALHACDSLVMLNDEALARSHASSIVTFDFVRHDRRRVAPMPSADRDAWVAATLAWKDVSGSWPSISMLDVLAVRGERLVVYRLSVAFDDGSENRFVALSRLDEALERSELVIYFDLEDVDLAMVELERLHGELRPG